MQPSVHLLLNSGEDDDDDDNDNKNKKDDDDNDQGSSGEGIVSRPAWLWAPPSHRGA